MQRAARESAVKRSDAGSSPARETIIMTESRKTYDLKKKYGRKHSLEILTDLKLMLKDTLGL